MRKEKNNKMTPNLKFLDQNEENNQEQLEGQDEHEEQLENQERTRNIIFKNFNN